MPLVKVEDAKGLYQTSGTGFQFIDGQAQPAQETKKNAYTVLTFADPGSDGGELDGLYFLLSSSTANFQFWFDASSGDDTAAPTAVAGYTLVEISVGDGNLAHTDVASAVVTAVNGAGSAGHFSASTPATGIVCITGQIPGPVLKSANIGTMTSTNLAITSEVDGSGAATLELDLNKEVTVLESLLASSGGTQPDNDGTAAPDVPGWTLGDGSYIGQKKLIVRNDEVNSQWQVQIGNLWDDDHLGWDEDVTLVFTDQQGTETPGDTNNMLRMVELIWTGIAWKRNSVAMVTAAITGGNAS